jgi:hypothetical protein
MGGSICLPCGPDSYSNITGTTQCLDCPVNTTSSSFYGSTSCVAVQPNSSTTSANASVTVTIHFNLPAINITASWATALFAQICPVIGCDPSQLSLAGVTSGGAFVSIQVASTSTVSAQTIASNLVDDISNPSSSALLALPAMANVDTATPVSVAATSTTSTPNSASSSAKAVGVFVAAIMVLISLALPRLSFL